MYCPVLSLSFCLSGVRLETNCAIWNITIPKCIVCMSQNFSRASKGEIPNNNKSGKEVKHIVVISDEMSLFIHWRAVGSTSRAMLVEAFITRTLCSSFSKNLTFSNSSQSLKLTTSKENNKSNARPSTHKPVCIRRYLNDNQIKELSPGVFNCNTELTDL